VREVFLTSNYTSPELLVQAIRTGAKEFLPQPIRENEVRQTIGAFLQRRKHVSAPEPAKKGRIVYVMGSKGGIGTTTIAVNIAADLVEKDRDQSVALVDMNKLFGDIPIFLSFEPHFDWGEIADNISRVDETFLMNVLTRHSSGIYVLPSPVRLDGMKLMDTAVIERILTFMERMFDYIVVDGGQMLDDISMKILRRADYVFLVSILSLPYLYNTRKILDSFQFLGYPRKEQVRIVVNRYLKDADISLKEAETTLETGIFRTLPNDYKTAMSAINQGKPITAIAPKSPIARSFRGLVDSVMGDEKKETKKGWHLFGAFRE
jgi:pilus assembly protein CpaE